MRFRPRTWIIQVIAVAVVLCVGVLMAFSRARAQPGSGARGGGVARPAATEAAANTGAPAKTDGISDADAGADAGSLEDQLADTVLPDGGGVPIHVEGEFRSPFANPRWGKPAEVRVGLVLNDLTEYDITKGTFEADFYLSLTSDREMPSMDLMFPNGKAEKEVIVDRPTFKLYRFTGKFTSVPDLRHYPFDTQELSIQIEENTEGVDQIHLVPDRAHTQLEVGFEVIGWDVTFLEATSIVHDYPDRFDNDDLYYGRYEFRLGIERYGTSAIFTVFVPAIVIVLIALMGQWMDFDHMEERTNAGAPMLAAAVLFHFALMQSLPAVSYLTRADKLMIGVYLSLLLCMGSTWTFFLVEASKHDLVYKLGKRIVPVLVITVMVLACVA